MEWFESITNILSLLFGGSIISLITWKIARRKAEAEAKEAEANAKKAEAEAAKEKQDYYQQMMDDLAKDRDYYKQERNEYRQTIKSYDERIDSLERAVARNGRMVEAMRPFMCADLACKLRKRVVLSENGDVKPKDDPRKRSKKADVAPVGTCTGDIEPLESDAL